MSSDLTVTSSAPSRGWASRLLGGLGTRRTADALPPGARASGNGSPAADRSGRDLQAVTRRLIADDRYAFVLLNEAADNVEDVDAEAAWEALERQMALVPSGVVPVVRSDGSIESTEVAAFHLDRFAITNQQFSRFVHAGSYDTLEIWPREIWPGLLRFTDRTGRAGPRNWENGTFPSDRAFHPVVGICWYEALAYARWAGKRLATSAEWQKAAGWPEHLSGGTCTRYPWGDLYSEGRANLWASGLARTAPVDAFREGSTLNGIYQMSGNVWEWLDDQLEAIPCRSDESFRAWKPMRRIIGGAFDTYLPAEATNQFVTGQPELDRRSNIGFRCAVSVDRLRPPPRPNSAPTRSPKR
jgi:formylglycine-generating enzyme required for sulfatase activity